jgi:hypothetical protein
MDNFKIVAIKALFFFMLTPKYFYEVNTINQWKLWEFEFFNFL